MGILAVGESVDPDQKSDGARADDTYETIAYRARPVRISGGWMRKTWREERSSRKRRESVFTVFAVSGMRCSRDISRPEKIAQEARHLKTVHGSDGISS